MFAVTVKGNLLIAIGLLLDCRTVRVGRCALPYIAQHRTVGRYGEGEGDGDGDGDGEGDLFKAKAKANQSYCPCY